MIEHQNEIEGNESLRKGKDIENLRWCFQKDQGIGARYISSVREDQFYKTRLENGGRQVADQIESEKRRGDDASSLGGSTVMMTIKGEKSRDSQYYANVKKIRHDAGHY